MHEPGTHRPVLRPASLADRLRAWPQHLLPHHAVSRLVFRLTRIEAPLFKNPAIRLFVRAFDVDLSEAEIPDPAGYPTFNAFFTRALRPGARPVAGGEREVACPVDGVVSLTGELDGRRILQAKGRDYSVVELLGGSAERAAPFEGGSFATLYLSPSDYHRVHMPFDGELREMVHVPGRLFSVDPPTTRVVPRVFARNERVAAVFRTPAGPMAVVLVGAINVAAIETVWAGLVTPPAGRRLVVTRYGNARVTLGKGDELGRFNMGSTVIVLFPPGTVEWASRLRPEATVRMGEKLAVLAPRRTA